MYIIILIHSYLHEVQLGDKISTTRRHSSYMNLDVLTLLLLAVLPPAAASFLLFLAALCALNFFLDGGLIPRYNITTTNITIIIYKQ